MICHICKKKTTWNKSYGRRSFIVCPKCFDKMCIEQFNGNDIKTIKYIHEKGYKIEQKS